MTERFSVVIPAYNEEHTLPATIEALVPALNEAGFDFEIIIVDDGSGDSTWTVIQSLHERYQQVRGVSNMEAHGYGYAVRAGLKAFQGSAVVIAMADGSDEPEDIIAYFRAIEAGYECAFGSRFMADAVVEGYPIVKRLVNRLGNRLIGLLMWSSYNDFTNGFKCYRREVIERIQPLMAGQFNLTIEMSMKAVKSGCRYAVVPTHWRDRESGVSKFHLFSQVWLYLATMAWLLADRWLAPTVTRPARPPDTVQRIQGPGE